MNEPVNKVAAQILNDTVIPKKPIPSEKCLWIRLPVTLKTLSVKDLNSEPIWR